METTLEVALSDLNRDGYCCVREVLSADEVVELRQAAFDIAESSAPGSTPGKDPLHHLGLAFAHPRFTDLASDARMVALLSEALTPNIHVYHSHLDIHPPEPPSDAWRWHEDGGRMTADLDMRALLSVKVGYFLSDVEAPGFGNLMVIPRSHRWTDPLPRTPGQEPEGAIPVLARAGDAVLIDRRVWHARSTNTSDRTRMVAFFGYSPRWIAQREITPPELLARETEPLRRQLLGAADWDTCHVARADLPVSAMLASGGGASQAAAVGGPP